MYNANFAIDSQLLKFGEHLQETLRSHAQQLAAAVRANQLQVATLLAAAVNETAAHSVGWRRGIGAELGDALAAEEDRRIVALREATLGLGAELSAVSAWSEPAWAALRRAGDHLATLAPQSPLPFHGLSMWEACDYHKRVVGLLGHVGTFLGEALAAAWPETTARISLALGADLDAPWAKRRAAEQEFSGSGTFLGDYLCAVGRSRAAVDRAEALARLAVRMLGEKNDSACAAVMVAISQARDAEPQRVRLGRVWVKDRDDRALSFVPIHHWRLDEIDEFEIYLTQVAKRVLAEDRYDGDDTLEPLVAGLKRSRIEDMTVIPSAALTPEETIASRQALTQLLVAFSPQERELVELLDEQATDDQICQSLGVKPGALRTRLSRLRKKVSSRL